MGKSVGRASQPEGMSAKALGSGGKGRDRGELGLSGGDRARVVELPGEEQELWGEKPAQASRRAS